MNLNRMLPPEPSCCWRPPRPSPPWPACTAGGGCGTTTAPTTARRPTRRVPARPSLPRWAGAIDFDVKPNKSEVYVDGVRIGVADSFDGWPDAFHTRSGKHKIRIVDSYS